MSEFTPTQERLKEIACNCEEIIMSRAVDNACAVPVTIKSGSREQRMAAFMALHAEKRESIKAGK